jgi:phosphatidylglycerol:prolipoprotein diacylglycerol transferase
MVQLPMYPELFSIGPFTIHTFGLMMALGFVAAAISAYFEFKRKGMNPEHVYWLTLAAAFGGLMGSKIHYLLLHMDEMRADPLATAFSGAGLVWYGGLIGGLLAAVIVCRLYKISIPMVLDAGAPAIAIGYAFGRMGCFLNGDDYGRPSTLPWAMQFPDGSPPTPPGVSVQPTQLYESFSALLIFAILMYLRPRLTSNWAMFCAFLVMAGIERFLVEFVRYHGEFAGIPREGQLQQQLLALGTAIVAGIVLYRIQRRAAAR